MTPKRQGELVDFVATQLGTPRMWRLILLCGIGAVLLLGVLGILIGVYVDGGATLDDLGLPLVFTAVLTPIVLGGLVYGVVGLRGIRQHELLLALAAHPPRIAKVERAHDQWGPAVRFILPSGAQYTIWMDAQTADEFGGWLAP